MLLRCCGTAVLGVLAIVCPSAARAQVATPARISVAVRGVAYDSVRGQPIRNAFVTVLGGAAGTTTDANGLFGFDSMPPGTYTFAMQHVQLDSLGFSGLSTRATISSDANEVRIAVPSFATLWRAACHSGTTPLDSGFVYGTVRNATSHRPVVHAAVRLTWIEMRLDAKDGFTQRTWHLETRSDSSGGYTLCGVPMNSVALRVRATLDSSASGELDLPIGQTRIYRRDLQLGPSAEWDMGRRGTIVGLLTDLMGDPFFNARVVTNGVPEVRTGADGHFILRDVPIGTRQIEFRSVGMVPVQSVVDVTAGDTASVIMQLGKATTLDAVHVERERRGRALAADFETRRKLGMGHSMDTTAILKYDHFSSVFANMPGLSAQYRGSNMLLTMPNGQGGICRPAVRLDGVIASYMNLVDLSPREVAGVEVFSRANQIPTGYSLPMSDAPCGMILVWTRYGFRER